MGRNQISYNTFFLGFEHLQPIFFNFDVFLVAVEVGHVVIYDNNLKLFFSEIISITIALDILVNISFKNVTFYEDRDGQFELIVFKMKFPLLFGNSYYLDKIYFYKRFI